MKPSTWGHILVVAASLLIVSAFFILVPPIAQDENYHLFADARTILGVPNFWNVVSNLPFAVVGLLGLWKLRGLANRVLFTGVLLTCFGSMYYHWAPSDARLIWDRLPMTLVFMPLLACVLARRADPRSSALLLALLVGCGIASILWWSVTNDLRPYLLVQFGPIVFLLPALRRADDHRYLLAVLALYTLAKLAELYDRAVYSVLPISGHSWKHVLAALATYSILCWRRNAVVKKNVDRNFVRRESLAAGLPS